jgi:hypothetical protein
MQAQKFRFQATRVGQAPVTPEQRAARITVIYPSGGVLPESFLRQAWTLDSGPPCLSGSGECDAVLLDLDGDGKDEILVLARPNSVTTAFKAEGDGWRSLGILINSGCNGVREGFRDGKFELEQAPYKDIAIGGTRLRLNEAVGCASAR